MGQWVGGVIVLTMMYWTDIHRFCMFWVRNTQNDDHNDDNDHGDHSFLNNITNCICSPKVHSVFLLEEGTHSFVLGQDVSQWLISVSVGSTLLDQFEAWSAFIIVPGRVYLSQPRTAHLAARSQPCFSSFTFHFCFFFWLWPLLLLFKGRGGVWRKRFLPEEALKRMCLMFYHWSERWYDRYKYFQKPHHCSSFGATDKNTFHLQFEVVFSVSWLANLATPNTK